MLLLQRDIPFHIWRQRYRVWISELHNCINSNSYAPYCHCSTKFTSFYNNHSHLYRTGDVNCYFINPTPCGEDINCFFSGSSCSGDCPVYLGFDIANCVLVKYNFVNNTDSSGYFWLGGETHKRVKESVIAFKSTYMLKWIYRNSKNSTLSIEGSFVIATGAIDGDEKVTLAAGTTTTVSLEPTNTSIPTQITSTAGNPRSDSQIHQIHLSPSSLW